MYDNVLAPTDGSAVAAKALETAIEIAQRNDAVLHVVHVVDSDTLPSSVSSIRVDEEFAELGEQIVEHARERGEAAGLEVETEVLSGHTPDAILEYADEHDVDLVVMGTHGRSGIDRMLLGSVTDHVVRAAPMPVLTVRLTEADADEYDGVGDLD